MHLVKIILCLGLLTLVAGCDGNDVDTPSPQPANAETALIAATYSADNPARILRLDSYHAEYLWSQSIELGLARALAEQGFSVSAGNVELDYFYMDTKRNTDPEYLSTTAGQAQSYILETQPDVVIVNDNNAVRLVLQEMTDSEIKFIFCGLNDDPATYGLTENPNITGVLERIHPEETVSWIELVFPAAERIVAIFDDTETSAAYAPVLEAALQTSPYADSYTIHFTKSFEAWQTLVQEAVQNNDILILGTYHSLRDADGQAVYEDTVVRWTVENSPIPIVSLWDFGVQQGALGGAVISGETQGYEAGKLAVQILAGTAPGSLPIVNPSRGQLMLNLEAIDHWNVTIPLELQEISTFYQEK